MRPRWRWIDWPFFSRTDGARRWVGTPSGWIALAVACVLVGGCAPSNLAEVLKAVGTSERSYCLKDRTVTPWGTHDGQLSGTGLKNGNLKCGPDGSMEVTSSPPAVTVPVPVQIEPQRLTPGGPAPTRQAIPRAVPQALPAPLDADLILTRWDIPLSAEWAPSVARVNGHTAPAIPTLTSSEQALLEAIGTLHGLGPMISLPARGESLGRGK